MNTPSLVVAASFLLASAAHAQEKTKLELKSSKGEKITRTSTRTSEGKMNVTYGGREPVEQDVLGKEAMTLNDEVLDSADGLPVKVRRAVKKWTVERRQPNAEDLVPEERELEGKTIVLTRKGDATDVEEAGNAPDLEIARHSLRGDSRLSNLPKDDVAVGTEWKLDVKALKADFEAGAAGSGRQVDCTSAKGTAKLEKIEEKDGVRIAVISVTAEYEGTLKEQEGITIKSMMKTQVRFAIAAGRVLSAKSEGTMEIKGEFEQGGMAITLDGKLKTTQEETNVWE